MIRNIKLFDARIEDSSITSAVELMKLGQIAAGEYVGLFEKKFGNIVQDDKIVAVSDMTSAMEIALTIAGVTANDEVLATPFSCMSSNAPIAMIGAKVKWMDFEEDKVSLSLDNIKSLISDKTKAIIIYHVAGYPSDIGDIVDYCRKNNIYIIEDCNNAHFSKIKSDYVGGYGDFAIYSFYPNRIINSIDGGVIRCRNREHYTKALKLRRFGIDSYNFRDSSGEIDADYDIAEAGRSSNMSNVSAAIAYYQTDHFEKRLELIQRNCRTLAENIVENENAQLVKETTNSLQCNWVFFILSKMQNEMLEYLKKNGIAASKLHLLNSRYSCFDTDVNIKTPNAEKLQREIIAIPCGWWVDESDCNYIAKVVNNFDSRS